MNRAHRIRLNPTTEQEEYFWQCAGVSRFTWNWALAAYNDGVPFSYLKTEFNRLRSEDGFAPFVSEVQSYAYQQAFNDLNAALSRYFKFQKEGRLKPPAGWKPRKDRKPFGWPRFKSRDKSTPSFYLANNGGMRFDGHGVVIQKCPGGPVNMAEPLRFDGKIMGGRVSYTGGYWYLAVSVQMDDPEPTADTSAAVGVDMGIKYRAVTSDGVIYNNPKSLAQNLRKLRKLQRSLSRMRDAAKAEGRKIGESNNYQKRKREIAKLHATIANIRREHAHEMTTELVREYGVVGVEDLNIRGMVKNRRLSRAVMDASMYQVRTQLDYKLKTSGGELVVVDRWYASSKTCNACGEKVDALPLSIRQWACPSCGAEHDRDGNAAKNIRDEALRMRG